jgi:hypothetical protein
MPNVSHSIVMPGVSAAPAPRHFTSSGRPSSRMLDQNVAPTANQFADSHIGIRREAERQRLERRKPSGSRQWILCERDVIARRHS